MGAPSKRGEPAGTIKRQPPQPLSPQDALEILAAALAECTRAGLRVTVGSAPERGSVIILPGTSATVRDGRAVFTVTPTEAS